MVELSARELGLLEVLLQRAGRLVSKDQLVERLCEWGEEVSLNAIDVYNHRQRKKIEKGPVRIATVPAASATASRRFLPDAPAPRVAWGKPGRNFFSARSALSSARSSTGCSRLLLLLDPSQHRGDMAGGTGHCQRASSTAPSNPTSRRSRAWSKSITTGSSSFCRNRRARFSGATMWIASTTSCSTDTARCSAANRTWPASRHRRSADARCGLPLRSSEIHGRAVRVASLWIAGSTLETPMALLQVAEDAREAVGARHGNHQGRAAAAVRDPAAGGVADLARAGAWHQAVVGGGSTHSAPSAGRVI